MNDLSGNLRSSFAYSADGNLTLISNSTGEKTKTMTYDTIGQLTGVNQATFTYDHHGRMIKSVAQDGRVTWYPSETCEVTEAAWGVPVYTSYIVHKSKRVASISTSPAAVPLTSPPVLYYHHDHSGSTVLVTNDRGDVLCSYSYDSFGKTVVDGADVSRYKYSGKEEFEGFYYFGARFYDPEVSETSLCPRIPQQRMLTSLFFLFRLPVS